VASESRRGTTGGLREPTAGPNANANVNANVNANANGHTNGNTNGERESRTRVGERLGGTYRLFTSRRTCGKCRAATEQQGSSTVKLRGTGTGQNVPKCWNGGVGG
jgi:hypothetical protein